MRSKLFSLFVTASLLTTPLLIPTRASAFSLSEIPARVGEFIQKAGAAHEVTVSTVLAAETDEYEEANETQTDYDAEEAARQAKEDAEALRTIQKETAAKERELKTFDALATKLRTQGVALPTDAADALRGAHGAIQTIKSAPSLSSLGTSVDELDNALEILRNNTETLTTLSTLSRIDKQSNQQLLKVNKLLAQSKATVDRLKKKNIDLTGIYTEFSATVNTLKTERSEAIAKIKGGDIDGFTDLDDNFTSQLDDANQYVTIIQTMANLGRFAADFKKRSGLLETQIKALAKKKIDVTEANDLLAEAKEKGAEVVELLKSADINEAEVVATLEEIEKAVQEVQDKIAELKGGW